MHFVFLYEGTLRNFQNSESVITLLITQLFLDEEFKESLRVSFYTGEIEI